MKATVFDIAKCSYVDGPGTRTTVFLKGCNLRCKWCHNPEGLSAEKQLMFYADKCDKCGKCLAVCPHNLKNCDACGRCEVYCHSGARKLAGQEMTAAEVVHEVKKDKIFYDLSGGGVTFSGGECMLRPDFLAEALEDCKAAGIRTAIDTAGNVPWESFKKVLPFTDLFLYDVKCISGGLHRAGTGCGNEVILENLKKLSECAEVTVRIPVVGGFNDSAAEMQKIAAFLSALRVKNTELLPYHGMAEKKYAALGMPFTKFSRVPADRLKTFASAIPSCTVRD